MRFEKLARPRPAELERILARIVRRTLALVERLGLREAEPDDAVLEPAGRSRAGPCPRPCRTPPSRRKPPPRWRRKIRAPQARGFRLSRTPGRRSADSASIVRFFRSPPDQFRPKALNATCLGKKGLIGGHIDEDDIAEGDLAKTFRGALLREAAEEAGVTEEIIKSVELCGLIKSDAGVDTDHLGLVYEMEITTDLIKSEEDGVLTGIWIPKDELKDHYESFENWAKIVYDNLLK